MRDEHNIESKPAGTLTLPTGMGTVHFLMTSPTHVYLFTERTMEKVHIRKVPYHLGFHMDLTGTSWAVTDLNLCSMSRQDKYGDTSQAAWQTAHDVLSSTWADYLAEHPELTRQVAVANAQAEIDRLAKELAVLIDQTATKKIELDAAKKRLTAIP